MKKITSFFRKEDGAAQMIEAAIIYPIVFLCITFLIYIGLYILQYMSVSAYAQKVALLASREIAYPGYINLVSGDPYADASVEANLDNSNGSFDGLINLSFDPSTVKARAYRYWKSNPLDGYEQPFKNILAKMIRENSIIGAKNEVDIVIKSENYFVVQYVTVSVSQQLMDFPVLEFFGIESPTVKATVQASANDTDEFVRNTDFAVDALNVIANKLGINVDGIKQKVQEAKKTLGLD